MFRRHKTTYGRRVPRPVRGLAWRRYLVVASAAAAISFGLCVSPAGAAGGTSVSGVTVSLNGPTAATGAYSGFSVSFTTSSTGGMSQADGSSWSVTFPTGTGLQGNYGVYGTVTDTTTDQVVGNVSQCGGTTACGTFNGGVVINPDDTLQISMYRMALPAAGSGYTVSVSTTSDTTPVTSTDSFTVLAAHAVSGVTVSLNGPTAATGAYSGFSVSFTTSSTGGMSQADGSSWSVTFPTGTGLQGNYGVYGTVTDTTTDQVVGNVSQCGGTTACGTFNGGVVINPDDTLQISMYRMALPAAGSGYTVSVSTTSDTTPVTSTDSFTVLAAHAVSGVTVSLNGPTAATGAYSGFSVSFTTSSTGGMSQADGSSWSVTFPTGTGLQGNYGVYGTVTDTTTDQVVGNVSQCGGTTACGTFNGGVVINPDDTLQISMYRMALPAAGSGYTVSVSTTSDTTPVTSTDSFTVLAAHAVSGVTVSLNGPTAATGAYSGFSVSFTTSSTGGMSQADGSSWSVTFPTGTGLQGNYGVYGTVTDTTTDQVVGNVSQCGGTTACGTFNGGVVINPDDTLQISMYRMALPAAGSGYTVSVSTTSDTTPVTSTDSFTVLAAHAVPNVTTPAVNPSAAGATGSYSLGITTSSTGGLSGQAGSTVTVTLPTGTTNAENAYVYDGATLVSGGCGGGGTTTLTCPIDSTVSPGDTLTFEFTATNPPEGTYTLGVSTSSDTIEVTSPSYTMTSAIPLSIELTPSPTTGAAPLATTFTLAPTDPDGQPVSYDLAFGDGAATSGTIDSPYTPITIAHTYTTPGTFNAGVSATDPLGGVASADATVTATGTVPLQPNAGGSLEAVVGQPVTLDGSGSQPASGITSYAWSFGDGNSGTGETVQHTYASPGTYTATLTIAGNGQTATAQAMVTVISKPAAGQGLTVSVTSGSSPLSGVSLAVITANGTRYAAITNSQGDGDIEGLPDGSYTVYAYATGYLPGTVTATQNGGVGSATLALQAGSISQTSATSTVLTEQQIVAAGINPDSPDNQNVYQFSVNLAFVADATTNNVQVSGDLTGCGFYQPTVSGALQTSPGGDCGSLSFSVGGYQVVGQVIDPQTSSPSTGAQPAVVWMIIPGRAQWLKEFFDVKMLVSNLAPSGYSFQGGSISLGALPTGLSLAPTANPQTTTQSVPTIPSGGSASVSWVLRGDAEGFYAVSATYQGTLDPGGFPLSFPISTAAGAIHVWGGSAIQLTIDADDHATIGDPYLVRVGLTDVANIPIYNADIQLLTQGRLNFIYQPDQQLTQGTAVIEPGATYWTNYYRLVPEITGSLLLSRSFVEQTAGNVTVPSSIITHPATPPDQVPGVTATPESNGIHLKWTAPSVSGITGYEIFWTPTRNTLFGPTPIATVSKTTTSDVIANGPTGFYAVSTKTASGLTLYNSLGGTPGSGASIKLTPATLSGGGKLTVSGSGFGSGTTKAKLYLDTTGTLLGTASVSSAGKFSTTLSITGVPAGTHAIIVVGPTGKSAVATFTVTATVVLSPTSASPGAKVTATLTAFQPDESVTFRWKTASGVVVGNTIATSKGTGTATIAVPDVAAGSYKVYGVGLYGTNVSTAFTVK